MFDLRLYKNVIRAAVERETELDPHWKWRVIAINKTKVKIGWGYLDFLNEKEPFVIELKEVNEEYYDLSLSGYKPRYNWENIENSEDEGYNFVYCWIGNKHWHDARTLEEGLAYTIHSLAQCAHNTY